MDSHFLDSIIANLPKDPTPPHPPKPNAEPTKRIYTSTPAQPPQWPTPDTTATTPLTTTPTSTAVNEHARASSREADIEQDFHDLPDEWIFDNLEAFVEAIIAPAYGIRNTMRHAWCEAWWDHPGVVSRLNALWTAWEYYRNQYPMTGMCRWYHYADHHMDRIMDTEKGILVACKDSGHHPQPHKGKLVSKPSPFSLTGSKDPRIPHKHP